MLLNKELHKYLNPLDEQTKNYIFNTVISNLIDKVLAKSHNFTGSNPEKSSKEILSYFSTALLQILKFRERVLQEKRKTSESINFGSALSDQNMHKGILICCIEVYSFIKNQHNFIDFDNLMEVAELNPLDIWRVLSLFLRYDQSMPHPVKKHLLELEINILSSKMWSDIDCVEIFLQQISEDQENQIEDSPVKKVKTGNEILVNENWFYSRVIQHAATQMYHLSLALELSMDIIEQVWSLLKYIFTEKAEILVYR